LLYSYIFIVTFVVASGHPAFVASTASTLQEVMMQVQGVILHPSLAVAYLVASSVAFEVTSLEASEEACLVGASAVASVVRAQEEQEALAVEVEQ
jgi:hypothetical protein